MTGKCVRTAVSFVVVSACILAVGVSFVPAQKPSLRAGAAKVDITPAADAALPMSGYSGRTEGHKGIHDDLNVRAIVLEDGRTQAAIIACEVIGLSNQLWDKFTQKITTETGIPRDNIILASVHTHAAPTPMSGGELPPNQTAYMVKLENAVVDSVRQAKAGLQPAKVGFGTGKALVNTNRRARDGEGGWMLGNNPEGVSDKTVAVIRFDNMNGEPIAIFSNYPCHATILGPANYQISSDLAGATARYVEKHYAGKVIAPWTSGTAGDQDPIYRVGTDFREVLALGEILGEEVVRVAEAVKTVPGGTIHTAQTVVSCPGKRSVQQPDKRTYVFADADPVSIRLSLLVLNDIAITGISGEVLTNIGLRIKKESPYSRTLVVTHCNGSSGYIPDDAAYDQVSYEIITTRLKRGCAENSIVDGLLQMMAAYF